MANQVKTTFTADTRAMDRAAVKLQADLNRYKQQRERDEAALTRQVERNAEARARAEIRSLQSVQREIQRLRREEQRAIQQNLGRTTGAIGSAAPYALGGLIGAGYLAQQAIDKAVEQSRANRLIASAATEAGVAQDKLSAANKRFAESVGLSNVAAATTTAQIQRLATYAGRPQDVEKLLRSFADLGAARGIGGRDLEGLIGTILSGQDEGLNRLGISDPGQLQKAYAASIGKTTEQLTQQEKVTAAVNAVMEKAAIFTGAADARMQSLEGTIAKNVAQWGNLTNAISTTVATSGPVTDFLNEVSRALSGVEFNIDRVNKKLREGKTPRQIAQEEYPGPRPGESISAGGTSAAFGLLPALFSDTYANAINPNAVADRRRKAFEDQIRAQQQANQQQERSAAQQRSQASIATYTTMLEQERQRVFGPEAIKKQLADAERATSLILQKPNVTIAELQRGLKSIPGLGLSSLDTQNLQQDFQRRIFDEQKRAADELKKKLEEVKKAKESAFDTRLGDSPNPFVNFLGKANQELRAMLENTKNLSPALRNLLLSDNAALNRSAFTSLGIQNRLDAYSLRTQAAEFRQGYRNDLSDPTTVQRILDTQLKIVGRGREGDQALINLAQSLDPRLLRQDQQRRVAGAFESEASRKLENEKSALDFYEGMRQFFTSDGLKVNLGGGQALDVTVNDQTSTGISFGTQGAVRGRYGTR